MAHLDEFTLNEYLDNELPNAKRAEVEAHLSKCEACQAELAELQQLFFSLDNVADAPFAVDVTVAVEQQIEQEKAVNSEPFSVNSGLVLVLELVAAGVLLFLLWPTVQEWLLLARGWQAQFAWTVTWPEPVSWTEIQASVTAVSQQFQAAPEIDLATMQWLVLIGVALIIWLAGNRLIFTNDSGGSHG